MISGIGQHQLISASAPSGHAVIFSLSRQRETANSRNLGNKTSQDSDPLLLSVELERSDAGARAVGWARERTRTRGKEGKDARARPQDDDDDCGSVRSRWPATFSGYRTWCHHSQ